MKSQIIRLLRHSAAVFCAGGHGAGLVGGLLLSLFLVSAAHAVPADPRPKKVRQADGTWITVVMRGDENASVTLTEDGRPVRYNTASGLFEAAAPPPADGRLPAAGRRNAVRRAAGAQRIRVNDFPTTGRQRSLVLLVEFSDVRFTSVGDPHTFYNRMLNEEGFTHANGACGSARDFYVSSSAGLFKPEFVVVGPVTLPNTAEYYGADFPERDAKVAEALRDACLAADAETDFSQFDANGDGYVDNIYYFYAGYGQADNPMAISAIWPHSANLEDAGISLECDGVKINNYACSNELVFDGSDVPMPTGIGTFVHEFGHVLGLADHYDVYSSRTFTVGPWDTMATGSYNNNGHTPPLFSAFERAELGWLTYTELTAATDTVSLLGNLGDTNRALRVSVPGNDNEYYVLENRQQQGWDEFLPGHGMLVWHIDMDEQAWLENTVNADTEHQRVDIVAADGKRTSTTRGGDPFPGTAGVESLALTSWAGGALPGLDAIAEQRGVVKIAVAGNDCRIPRPERIDVTALADSSFTLTWTEVPAASRYLLTVYSIGDDGARTAVDGYGGVEFDEVPVVSVGGLVPLSDYVISVVAAMGSHLSDALTATVTTAETPFEKLRPGNLRAYDVSSTAFTASWAAVRDADSYDVTLYEKKPDVAPADLGYDFTGKAEGLPALWTTSSTTYYSVSGYYGAAAPSLRLSADGDYIEVAWPESTVTQLSFWCRSRNGDGLIYIEESNGDGWNVTASVVPPADGATLSFSIGDAPRVRIRYGRESGFVAVDDIVASCRVLGRVPVDGFDGLLVGNVLSYSFSGLVPSTDYTLRVTARSGDRRSLPSAECAVTTATADGIETAHATGGDSPSSAAVYDLSGRRLPQDCRKGGPVIIRRGGVTVKSIRPH